jgi:predicted PP-loop superfamily ATPase
MAKLCPKGKAAAKRKFDVYPSAYANMYASAICSGKIKEGGKNKKKVKAKKGTTGGLRKWVGEKWVDIGAPKKDGKFQPCGRKSAKKSKRKYPKCVPLAKAKRMTAGQRTSKAAKQQLRKKYRT